MVRVNVKEDLKFCEKVQGVGFGSGGGGGGGGGGRVLGVQMDKLGGSSRGGGSGWL